MINPFNLPFDEAIEFFRKKLLMPTASWQDLWHEMHDRAFSVAGAMQEDLLNDFKQSIDKAIAEGTTLEAFQEDFDNIVNTHGWAYRGGREWRAAIIFQTNIAVAYAKGHYEAMTDPDVLEARPYFRYIRSSSRNKRPEHRKWYNLILPADDPFWETHYPPNGWGCKCGIINHSAREVEKIKKEEKDGGYPVQQTAPGDKFYNWTDKKDKVHKIPVGIDPGWDYNPGKTGFKDNAD